MKVCIIGAFGFDTMPTGGQPVKTRNLYQLLSEKYGANEVAHIETYGWKKHPFKMIAAVRRAVKQSENVIMLPAHNGVKVFAPLLLRYAKGTSVKLFYDVIGGWLPQKTEADPKLAAQLRRFNGIWVETSSMKNALERQGFSNVSVVPNFKFITPLAAKELPPLEKPYRLCTFSRVMKEKGIEDAIKAVTQVNDDFGETVFTLDIYGPVDNAYQERFEDIRSKFPDYIWYKGVARPDESVTILKGAFALLFPTHFTTEGIPGTILDAYAAGVPIVTTKWDNCGDILYDGTTGWGYEMSDTQGLYTILSRICRDTGKWNDVRKSCLKKYAYFSADWVGALIQTQLSGNEA